MAATSQSSTQQVPMIDVWKSCTLCSAVVITSLRVLESNYSLFHKSQNHFIEFTIYFSQENSYFGRTFPRKTRCSWRCLDVFIQRFRVDFFRTNGPALWTCDPGFSMWLFFVCVCVTDSWRVAYAWLVHVISIWFTYVWFKTAQFPCMFFCMFCNVVYVNYLYCRWFCVCVCVCFLNILNLCQCAYAISVRAADFELLHSWFVCTKCLLHLTPLGCLEISIISLKINWGLPNPQMAMHLISQPQTVSSVRSAPSPSPQVVYKMFN